MKVAIRDDDTSYFTAPDALTRVYGDIWDRVPICLAVVPFANAIGFATTAKLQPINSAASAANLDKEAMNHS